MKRRTKIHKISESDLGKEIAVSGWIRTVRDQKSFLFIELNDGSTLSNLQVIADEALRNDQLTTGAALTVYGTLVASPGHKQRWELQAKELKILGSCSSEEYPLQKKRHSFEFLRTIAHLRPRQNQSILYARQRRWQNSCRDGCPRSQNRRDHWRQPTRRAFGPSRKKDHRLRPKTR